VDSLCKFS